LKSGLKDANTATPGKTVTVSDEAFALLIYENFVDKWIKAAAKEEKRTRQRQDNTTRIRTRLQKGCEECTLVQQLKVDNASLKDGTAWCVLLNCLLWSRKIELVLKRS
jgi:hypothetical protein